jgi:long-chain acyl-CoA synthetase
VKSPYLFERYWNNDAATAAVKPADGWMRTGDIGELRDGALRLIDRARDFIVTSGGKTLSPSVTENALRSSPFVMEAVVFGHGRKYLAALIELDCDQVANWARANGVACTDLAAMIAHPAIHALIGGEVEKANVSLARVEQIKAFRFLPVTLNPLEPGAPVTPTRKVKRQELYERFKDLVDGMYDDAEDRLISSEAKVALVA